jgi:predicted SnoaL-like aldol condensation-catalyzing enzyme
MSTATEWMEKAADETGTSSTESRKHVAVEFLKAAASGRARQAGAEYCDRAFRHHNVHFPGDAESLLAAMDENARQNPEKKLDVKHVLAEGDLVAVHSEVHHRPGDSGAMLVHLFRFEGDRIVELWDVGQEIPADSPNANGPF